MSNNIVQLLINGFITGSYYALISAGLSLIWGVLKMVNIAHGEFYMLGAYFLQIFLTVMGLPVILSVLVSIAVVFVIGALIELSLIKPMMSRPNWGHAPFVLTLGVSIFLQNIALHVWGERSKSVPYFSDTIIKVFGGTVASQRLIIFAVSVISIVALMLIIKHAKIGWAIRATSQSKMAATVVGINTNNIYLLTFSLSAALAAIAGCLLAPIFGINPWMGNLIMLKAFVVCVLGGLGSLEGAILAGLLLGLVESFAVQHIGSEWKDVFAYIVLIFVLWVKPTGIFGKKEW